MKFTFEQMRLALERAGYRVVLEDTTEEFSRSIITEVVNRKVWSVYTASNYKMNELVARPFGTAVVEYVFEQELKKRVLHLFAVD